MLFDQSQMLNNQAYNDGRSDARTYCRTHAADERVTKRWSIQAMCADVERPFSESQQWYWTGYLEILSNWTDEQGA